MDVREFPVLSDDDRELVDRLAVGLGEEPARVLAYLLLRAEQESSSDDPASLLAIRVGTELGRKAVRDALSRLRDRDLVAATTVRNETRGRPPQAWSAPCDRETTIERTYDRHADALLRRARTGFDVAGESPGPNDRSAAGDRSRASDSDQPSESDGDRPREASGDQNSEADEDQPPGADRETTVGLNWTPNGLHLPLFAAAGGGEYAARGLSVEFDRHAGSSASLAAVTGGEATVGVAGAASVLRARQRGEPVVPVALLFQRAMTVLYTDRDRFGDELDSVEQLRGHRVGMPLETEAGLLGRLFLSQSGVLSDVELVDLAGEERRALRSGEVDVVTGSFSDPRELRKEGVPVDSLRVADHFPIYGPSLVATEATLRRRRGLLADFLAGTAAGWAAATRRPCDVSTPAGIALGDDDRRTFELAAAEFGANDAVREHGWGWQDRDAWRRLEPALSMAGLDE